MSDGYGYQWWVDAKDYYMAAGFGGQYIFVIPDKDINVVFTAGMSLTDFCGSRDTARELYPSCCGVIHTASRESLRTQPTPSPHESSRKPEPTGTSPLPAMAQVVSGRRYVFDPNDLNFHSFSLSFGAETNEALLDFSYRDRNLVQIPVGLDNVPRVKEAEGYLRAYEGTWLSDDTFFMPYQIVGYSENGTFKITVSGNEAFVTFTVQTSESTTGTARTDSLSYPILSETGRRELSHCRIEEHSSLELRTIERVFFSART